MNKLTARELMTRDVLTVRPDWGVGRLMQFFADHSISGAPVVNDAGDPIGVVSLTDIARNGTIADRTSEEGLSHYRDLRSVVGPEEVARFRVDSADEVVVQEIMTPMVFAVDETTAIQDVAEMMITGRIHRVFVKQNGKLTGVVTSMDLLPLVRDMT